MYKHITTSVLWISIAEQIHFNEYDLNSLEL